MSRLPAAVSRQEYLVPSLPEALRPKLALGSSLVPLPFLLALLGVGRLLPAGSAVGAYVRLAAATALVLVPGRLIAQAVGRRDAASTVGWALAAVAAALALTFAVRGSLTLAIVLYALLGLAALPWAGRGRASVRPRGSLLVLLVGVGLGFALWHVAGVDHADSFTHIGRIRRLDDLGSLSLHSMDEFRNGSLHTGYAFPLWHAFLAFVSRLGGLDPSVVVLHEPSVIAPLALLVAYEAGVAVFASAALGGAVVAATLGLYAFAGTGGVPFATLAAPNAFARFVLAPAALAAFFRYLRKPGWGLAAAVAACSLDLAFVHVTYGLFVLMLLCAFAVVRVAFVRGEVRLALVPLAAFAVPLAGVVLWLLPIIRSTAGFQPSLVEQRRGLLHYAGYLDIASLHAYHLRPEMLAQDGPVALVALLLLPLAFLAARHRWAAFALGGTVLVLGIELSSLLFPQFSNLVSLSQSRRLTGFVPLAIAFAGVAAVLARALGAFLLPIALAAGIALELAFPGRLGLGPLASGPAIAAWVALFGGLAALVVATLCSPRARVERRGLVPLLAAALFVAPIAVHAAAHWSPVVSRDRTALTPGLVRALRDDVPPRSVVYAGPATSYRIFAAAPVYVADVPPPHIADTRKNEPCARVREYAIFARTGDLRIPQAYGARWLVLRRGQLQALRRRLPLVYADGRFALLRVPAPRGGTPPLPHVATACTAAGSAD